MPHPPAHFAISATAFNRPDRLWALLDSIAKARYCTNWPIFLSIEPSPQMAAILAVVAGFQSLLQINTRVNAAKKGVRQNPFDTVEWVIGQGFDVVLLLEDDLLVDQQALAWCEALVDAGELAKADVMCANLLTTTCMSESIFIPTPSEYLALADTVVRGRFFSSYGLLFHKKQWQRHFVPNWFNDEPPMQNWIGARAQGWDVALNRLLLTTPELVVLQSLVPRVNHDGAGGTHVSDRFQASSFDNLDLSLFQGQPLPPLRVLDPQSDLDQVHSVSARMYLNLCRHLWTLQASSLEMFHAIPDRADKPPRRLRIGSHEYQIHRRRIRP